MIRFTKMHGLGNDFMVVDGVNQRFDLDPERIRRLADRHFGIGFDQLLLVEPPDRPGVDFRYRIFNADGGEVGQCGNGARCFARFVRDRGLTEQDRIAVSTRGGVLELQFQPDGRVSVAMGVPCFEPNDIPLRAEVRVPRYMLTLDGHEYAFGAVSMGNPHAVLTVDDVDRAPVRELGPRIERHSLFPEGVNVGFMQIVDRGRIRLRVFERGVGETLACGSGACAAVAAGCSWERLDANVAVELPGGELDIYWPGEGEQMIMTGPAVRVFEGEIDI